MKRRTFFKTSALASPAFVLACNRIPEDPKSSKDPLLEKVTQAMLSMQRASWEQGVAAQSILESGNDELTFLMAKEAVLRQLEDGRLSVVYTDNGVTDPIASGQAVLYAAKKMNDPLLQNAADRMLNFIATTKHKTSKGILHHTMNNPEIWIDSMYMAPPFLAYAGEYDEAFKQIEGFRKALWNPEKKLYSHRWDVKKQVFINEKFWGVGNGWALAGIARVIELLPETQKEQKKILIKYASEHLQSVLKYCRSDELFHNILDDKDSFVETNLSQMVAYTIYTGVHASWLDSALIHKADELRNAVRNKVDDFGYVQGVCGAPYFDSPGRATEGQAFFILMEAARKKYLDSLN